MLLSSTLFHGFKFTRYGKKFMILDHIAIYTMIAGTYTALLYRYINTDSGQILMITLWSITAIGSVFKIFLQESGIPSVDYFISLWLASSFSYSLSFCPPFLLRFSIGCISEEEPM